MAEGKPNCYEGNEIFKKLNIISVEKFTNRVAHGTISGCGDKERQWLSQIKAKLFKMYKWNLEHSWDYNRNEIPL